MSTEIPFTANHTQQPFKLLELPPELLALLESDVPPTLLLTSSPQHPHHAHLLVTPSSASTSTSTSTSTPQPPSTKKTYLLRQKNTSNPLMLLSPSTHLSPSSSTPEPSITRIGSISDTIELIAKEEELIAGEGNNKDQPTNIEVAKKTTTGKVNKWHEKFAKSRGNGANTKG